MSVFLTIAGAGPGDPELLTVKALNRIAEADYILHDALVSNEILNLARPGTVKIYVGKLYNDGQEQALRQESINKMIVELVAKRKKVLRLKSGDPMIFGRGAEEIRFCIENKIAYELIPGISAAFGASAIHGIPLTERGKNSMVLIGTGHYCENDFCDIDTFISVLNSGSPIILYMALNKLVKLSDSLISKGVSTEIKIQVMSKVSQPGSNVYTSNLGNIKDFLEINKPPMPAIVFIGRNIEKLSN